MKVRTSYLDCDYITPDRTYDVMGYENNFPIIICDSGDDIIIAIDEHGCAHLDFIGTWEIIEED